MITLKHIKFFLLGGFTWFFATSQMYLYTQVIILSDGLAYAFTQLIIICLNFILARYWIFYSTTENPLAQGGKFVLAVFVFRFTDWCLFMVLSQMVGIVYFLAIFLSMVVVFPFKYITYKAWVFRDHQV